LLELKDVSASYTGGVRVLSGVSLRVEAGHVCAILGANGAGKSTLLRAVMGLLPHVSGEIIGPEGRKISGSRTFEIARQGIAYVPEGRGILYSLNVRENLLIGATTLPARERAKALEVRMEKMLQLFPILGQRLAQRAGSLSGGQQQMLAIARAMISDPKVPLLDEPSLGLAPLVKREIADVLNQVRKERDIAIVLVEQDIKMAQACASRALVLRQGQLIDELPIDEIAGSERLRHAYLGIGKLPTSAVN